jgi:sirohydrochlorin ferrochelatase
MRAPDSQICFLFDNGSPRPSSTLSLRETAALLGGILPAPVRAVSLPRPDAVDAAAPGGARAEPLETAARDWWGKNPGGEAVLLPLFFGPGAALTGLVPARMEAARKAFPRARWRLARWLVEPGETDDGIARALASGARRVIAAEKLGRPRVVLVDHGSPQRAVAAVREHLGAQLRRLLGGDAAETGTASMERRAGAEFAFNEPLLAARLRTPPFDAGDVVVLLQFLSPGRHAGPGGDIAAICAEARRERPGLRTWMTAPLGAAPEVIEKLARRFAEAQDRPLAKSG